MRGEHFRRPDHGRAGERCVFLLMGGHPKRGRVKHRFADFLSVWKEFAIVRNQRKNMFRHQPIARLLHPLNADAVMTGRQSGVIGQPNFREDQSEIRRDVIAHVGYARVQTRRRIERHLDQIRGEFDMDIVDVEHVTHGFLLRPGLWRGHFHRFAPCTRPFGAPQHIGRRAEDDGPCGERHEGEARHETEKRHQDRNGGQGGRIFTKLAEQFQIGRAFRPAAREQDGRCDRDDDRRYLADEAVADRKNRIGLKRAIERHSMHDGADKQPDHEVEHRD